MSWIKELFRSKPIIKDHEKNSKDKKNMILDKHLENEKAIKQHKGISKNTNTMLNEKNISSAHDTSSDYEKEFPNLMSGDGEDDNLQILDDYMFMDMLEED